MAVRIGASATFMAGKPAMLFELHDLAPDTGFRNLYAVSSDGNHFLTANLQAELSTVPITVVLNWSTDLPH
jgi:hypothetical protein